ncbi:MAG: hypothetical protein KIS96_15675 [Bauldia sp.]|nr:hypothetical protein [Bauldia sp.]
MPLRNPIPHIDPSSNAGRKVHAAAETLCSAVEKRMELLLRLVEEETRLVREGKLFALRALEPRKARAAREFIDGLEAVKKIRPALELNAPEAIGRLRRKHSEFRAMLQLNLAALATAREASDEMLSTIANGGSLGRHSLAEHAA